MGTFEWSTISHNDEKAIRTSLNFPHLFLDKFTRELLSEAHVWDNIYKYWLEVKRVFVRIHPQECMIRAWLQPIVIYGQQTTM